MSNAASQGRNGPPGGAGRVANVPEHPPSHIKKGIPDRVDYWLLEWSRWLDIAPGCWLGYPGRVKVFIGGGESQRTEDFEEDQWDSIRETNCAAMDALVCGLPELEKKVVFHVYCGEGRVDAGICGDVLVSAAERLLIGMNARCVM